MSFPQTVSLLDRARIRAEDHIHTKHGPLIGRLREQLMRCFYISRFILLKARAKKLPLAEAEFERHTRWRLDVLNADLSAFAQRQIAASYKSSKFVTDRVKSLEDRAPIIQTSFALESETKHLVIRRHLRSSDTVVFNVALGESYRSTVSRALESHMVYAKLHGYDYASLEAVNHNQRPAPWYKIALASNCIQMGYKNLLFIDADCLITNYHINFLSLIKRFAGPNNDPCCYVAEDEGGINTGVLLMQSAPELVVILDMIWNNTAFLHHNNWEQEALKNLLIEFPSMQKFFRIVYGGKTFNTFPSERLQLVPNLHLQPNTWRPGDFLCHFSGIRGRMLTQLISQYFAKYPPPCVSGKNIHHEA